MRFCFDDKVYICFAVTARGMTVAAFRDRNREVSQMICFQILLDLSHHTHTHVCTLTWLLTNSHRSHTFINMIISNNHSVNVNLLNIWHVCWTLFLVQAVLHYSGISRCSYRRDTRNTNDKEEQSLADNPPGTPQIWRALTSVVTDWYAPLSALSGDIGSASFATFVAYSAYYSTL